MDRTPRVVMAAERYANGESMEALGTEYDVDPATIWRAIKGRPFVTSV
jgi:hypothetical protein